MLGLKLNYGLKFNGTGDDDEFVNNPQIGAKEILIGVGLGYQLNKWMQLRTESIFTNRYGGKWEKYDSYERIIPNLKKEPHFFSAYGNYYLLLNEDDIFIVPKLRFFVSGRSWDFEKDNRGRIVNNIPRRAVYHEIDISFMSSVKNSKYAFMIDWNNYPGTQRNFRFSLGVGLLIYNEILKIYANFTEGSGLIGKLSIGLQLY